VCFDVAKDCRGQKAPFGPDLSCQAVILVENRTAIVTLVTRFVHLYIGLYVQCQLLSDLKQS
jgi:cytochrome b subunit of formate dehydrogenase